MRKCVLMVGFVLLMSGCDVSAQESDASPEEVAPQDETEASVPDPVEADAERATDPAPEAADDEEPEEPPDPAAVGANELGAVPVLMYHGIVDEPDSDWEITPAEFLGELEFLHEHDYFPVQAAELARRDLDVPAGKTPVVLTFDDALPSQAAYTEAGDIDADSAVGIMLAFAEAHPEFPATGTFYVTDKLFDDASAGEALLAELHELGFELGNHTLGHANLSTVGDDEAHRQMALGAQQIREAVPQARVETLALPLGRWPEPRELAFEGNHEGIEYEHAGVMLVGAHPSPSPFDAEFEPLGIPRIRSTPEWDGGEPDYASGFWLEWLEAEPERKYVSDGNPGRVSFPAGLEAQLGDQHSDRANPY